MTAVFTRLRRLPRRHFYALLLAVSLTAAMLLVQRSDAGLAGPQQNDRQVTLVVTSLLKREHLTRAPLDDEISRRCMKIYLKGLDPMKLYFTQADIDRFMKHETDIDDMVKRGDIAFAYEVFNTYLQRLDERVALVDKLLEEVPDFAAHDEMVTDPDSLAYAKDEAEIVDRWRKRIKYEILVQKTEKTPPEEVKAKPRRYHSISKRMSQTHEDELLEMYLTALSTAYDPHTSYMSASSLENFEIVMGLQLEGIGAGVQFEDGYTTVSKLIPGGAAEKDARLKPEDRVIGVGQGKEGDFTDVVDMNLTDVVKLIRGKPGTIVRLKVIPIGKTEPQTYAITRAKIELKDSEARAEIIEQGTKADGTPYRVGVIDLPSFYMDMDGARLGLAEYKSTTRDVERLLRDFRKKGVDAVILDLRRNGGGSLTESISLTGLFIDQGPVVQVKDADGKVQQYEDLEPGAAWDGPLVVLISKFSASASEIFAGAIQDYRRGIVVGDYSTHGKGTVQSLLDLGRQLFRIPNAPSLGALKITMQQFYRPNGDSTQDRGVLSDVELPSLTTHLDVGEADLEHHLEFDRVPSARFPKLGMVDETVVKELRQLSGGRLSKSEDFQKVLKNIEKYKAQKARKRVSLNEEEFMADRADLDADAQEDKELEEMNDPNRPVVKRDYYFNEALAITLDYLRLVKVASLAGSH